MILNTLVIMAATLLSLSCEKEPEKTNQPKERADIVLTKVQQQISYNANAFTFEFLKAACNKEQAGKNIFVSPFSIQMALSMAAAGAVGDTQGEMYSAIGFNDFSSAEVGGFYRYLIPALQDVDNTTTFEIANSFWSKPIIVVKDDYANDIKENFFAEVRDLPDNGQQAVAEINGWCKERTHGMIDRIVDKIDDDIMVSLLNAIYFKGSWSEPFDKSLSKDDKFTNWDGSTVKKTFMNRTFNNARVYSDEYVEAMSIPYGNEAFAMTIVVPRSGTTVEKVLEGLDRDRWLNFLYDGYLYDAVFSMPRFEQEYAADKLCIEILQDMGMQLAFSGSADFSAMSDTPMCIDEVRHKAKIKVDEEGTEAAAVTYIGMRLTAIAPASEVFYFKADRPFLYFISEKSTGAILFAGIKQSL